MNHSLDVDRALQRLGEELRACFDGKRRSRPLLIGIHTGGVWIAERLRSALDIEEPMGTLNINFYRDDFTRIGMHPRVTPSHLPFSVDERHIILIDDVLHTGRTVRAALNEIFDYGRPASVTLGALVERSGREIPVQADAVGLSMSPAPDEYVNLAGPQPLELVVQKRR